MNNARLIFSEGVGKNQFAEPMEVFSLAESTDPDPARFDKTMKVFRSCHEPDIVFPCIEFLFSKKFEIFAPITGDHEDGPMVVLGIFHATISHSASRMRFLAVLK